MSFFRDFYYEVKPFLPLGVRMAVRRAIARVQLERSRDRWPIFPAAGMPPQDWKGWPGGKKFALVLTHDVESQGGLERCESLLQLERELGVRSSFNFVPEGSYKVSRALIQRIKAEGFEVGVHDLHHNGKLYRNKKSFDAAAPRINQYLRDWEAVGFRSGFMQRNLEWLHALDIEYDMSTFDTDPFEPQPDGTHTIFPFMVRNGGSKGYAELPYTLPQDSTIFLLLQHKDDAIWKSKVEWIANSGGMALINVHPDYLDFGQGGRATFPASLYRDFLRYVQATYAGAYTCMLPRDVAAHLTRNSRGRSLQVESRPTEVSPAN